MSEPLPSYVLDLLMENYRYNHYEVLHFWTRPSDNSYLIILHIAEEDGSFLNFVRVYKSRIENEWRFNIDKVMKFC